MFNYLSKKSFLGTLFTVALGLSAPTAWADNDQLAVEWVKTADSYRVQEKDMRVVSKVSSFKNGELDQTRLYHVFTRTNRESLVLFKSKVEAGQKMLMLGDNYWLVMPKSRRPIRITPVQKLMGDASIGDISSLTWSQDYAITWSEYQDVTVDGQNIETAKLLLTAKTKGASYQNITLWLSTEDQFPIKADMYLRSGKLAKQAEFVADQRDGKTVVGTMKLKDSLQPWKETHIEYVESIEKSIADKYYNPSFLVRNSELSL